MARRAVKRQPYGKGGRVRVLPSGRWQARFLGPDGIERPAPQTFESKMDAEGWCRRQADEVDAGRWTAESTRPHDRQTFASYARRWIEGRDLKPRTRIDYQAYIDDVLIPRWGDYRLDAITPAL